VKKLLFGAAFLSLSVALAVRGDTTLTYLLQPLSAAGTNTVPVVTASNIITYERVPNAALANSSVSINGNSCSLGATCTFGQQTTSGSLSSAQILALSVTPVTAVAAQGSGTVIIVDSFTAEIIAGAAAYTCINCNLVLAYGSGVSVPASAPGCAKGFLTNTANFFCNGVSTQTNGSAVASTSVANTAINWELDAAVLTGNGTISYWISYHVLTGF